MAAIDVLEKQVRTHEQSHASGIASRIFGTDSRTAPARWLSNGNFTAPQADRQTLCVRPFPWVRYHTRSVVERGNLCPRLFAEDLSPLGFEVLSTTNNFAVSGRALSTCVGISVAGLTLSASRRRMTVFWCLREWEHVKFIGGR